MDAKVDISDVVLETQRLILRSWNKEDVDDLYEYASVPGVGEMAGWSHHQNIEESKCILKMFIEHKKTFALVDKKTKKVIGSLGLESVEGHEGEKLKDLQGREIGYVLSKDYWGQGLMAEAVRGVIDWCFTDMNYDFLLCGNFVENRQSARVQEKVGFQFYQLINYETSSQKMKVSEMRIMMNPNKGGDII